MDREELIKNEMVVKNLDALIILLPENILFFSCYWPSTASALFLPKTDKPVLIIPKPDKDFVSSKWEGDVWVYNTRLADDPTDIYISKLLKKAIEKSGLRKGRIGCDSSMETVAGTHIGGEAYIPGQPFYKLLKSDLVDFIFEDVTTWIYQKRMVKTPNEIKALKKCNHIVDNALLNARKNLHPGMKEIELSTLIESKIQIYGVGYEGVRRARGFAFVMSGAENTSTAWGAYNISTDREINEGDLILIELDTHADGYWSDVSRTFVVGEPTEKQKEIWSLVNECQQRTINSLRVGGKISTVDETARNLLREAGYGEFFLNHVGHGVGFAFHEMPYLEPPQKINEDYTIEKGMVFAIEPAIYIEGWGGIRLEDNIFMNESGHAEYLSNSDRSL